MRRAPAPLILVLSALLLAGCSPDNGSDPVPTGGEITGDTSVIETPTGEATE